MKLEIAKLLKQIIDTIYGVIEPDCEIRILYVPYLVSDQNAFELELKTTHQSITGGETIYLEDEGAVLHHIGEVLNDKRK